MKNFFMGLSIGFRASRVWLSFRQLVPCFRFSVADT
jgi:hypothetical protein